VFDIFALNMDVAQRIASWNDVPFLVSMEKFEREKQRNQEEVKDIRER
jgi:hypothetical protein